MPAEEDVIYIGRTDFRGAERLFGIKQNDRFQHMYIVGKSGTGKTTLINNMVVQDIAQGSGLALVDPHGDLVDEIIDRIPASRLQDVIYFNPGDIDYSIGFNVMELADPTDEKEKNSVASGLMSIFNKLFAGTWSSRQEHIMNNTILALLDSPGSTLLGIPRIFADSAYRQQILNEVRNPSVLSFWLNEYETWDDRYRKEAIAPIQNKVGHFLATPLVRNIVGQSKSTIDMYKLMNEGKIFLANLSKGQIGEDNSALLGAMLITKIQLAAEKRAEIKDKSQRVDFFLYVDEFQNFATDSFATILSEARKYRLGLVVAHQYIGQLVTDTSTKVRDAIFGNVGTMMTFRVGADDAAFLEKEFSPEFEAQDLINLPNRRIFIKLLVDGVAQRPFSASTLPAFNATEISVPIEDIIASSRKRYAKPRYIIETEINQNSGLGAAEQIRLKTGAAGAPPPSRVRAAALHQGNASDLAALGFDLGADRPRGPRPPHAGPPRDFRPAPRGPAPQGPRPPMQQRPPEPPRVAPQPKPAPARGPGSLSLSNLASGPRKEVARRESAVDVDALKESIAKSLKAHHEKGE